MRRFIHKNFFALILSIFFTIIFLFPVISHFTTHLTSRADGVFISWTIYTVSKFLAEGKNIFNMPIFFPYENVLTYSDPFISTAIINLPLLAMTKNIVAMQNFHFVFGTIIMYLASYFLGRQMKFTKLASHFLAFFFTFSSVQTRYLVHLHTYLIAGLPLTFLFLLKWFENKKWHWLFLAALSFLYQALNSIMNGFFILLALVPLVINKSAWKIFIKNWQIVIYYFLFAAIILGIFLAPYFLTSQQFEYTRSIRDAAHFAFSLDRLFQLDLLFDFAFLFFLWKKSKYWFGSQLLKENIDNKIPALNVKTASIIAATGLILMLGPVLKIHDQTFKFFGFPIPLPYAILYYIVPGFKAFRASSRWILLLNFGLAILIGKFVNASKIKQKYLCLIFGILISAQLYFNYTQFELYEIPTKVPKIYEVLKHRNEKVVAELPAFSWGVLDYAYLENNRLLYQTYHEKSLYNGTSGFIPPDRELELDLLWKEFPNEKTIKILKNAGVELIIIHYDVYDIMGEQGFSNNVPQSPSADKLQEKVNQTGQFKLIDCQEKKCLYKINRPDYGNQHL